MLHDRLGGPFYWVAFYFEDCQLLEFGQIGRQPGQLIAREAQHLQWCQSRAQKKLLSTSLEVHETARL